MSEIANSGRDAKTGRFQTGNIGGGRPKGRRAKLSEVFIADLHAVWQTHGLAALEKCAVEEPSQFVRVIASLMPRDINLAVAVDAASFVDKFRAAAELLGHDIDPPRLRRPMRRTPPLIEHNDA
jgi:hypothetical protein